eukprot:Amastigsp_a517392_102.p1 type:complete len:115 gc:universal Amastigsp_a517392_102:368-24(-)
MLSVSHPLVPKRSRELRLSAQTAPQNTQVVADMDPNKVGAEYLSHCKDFGDAIIAVSFQTVSTIRVRQPKAIGVRVFVNAVSNRCLATPWCAVSSRGQFCAWNQSLHVLLRILV